MSDFVHLHTHSHYSLLDGMGKIDELVDQALAHNMQALALTDHGVLYGAIEFYGKARKKGLKPIIGMEAYITQGIYNDPKPKEQLFHLILLAENEQGYRNLIALTSEAHLHGYYFRPRIDRQLLTQHSSGLICLSACLGGEVSQAILAGNEEKIAETITFYKELFGPGRYYLELQDHPQSPEQKKVNTRLLDLGKAFDIPLVATADVHYILPEDKEAHDALLCVQTGKFVSDTERLRLTDYDIFLKTEQQIASSFAHLPELILNSKAIAERVHLELALGTPKLPKFPTPHHEPAQDYLTKLCQDRLHKRYPITRPEITDRLEKELRVIEQTGFADYFLIVADFVNWSRDHGILVGPGRGSAAGSIVSYILGITNLDPLKYQLIFERFLSPDRIAPPDIDLDFADRRRDEVIAYVTQRYGEDHVAQIITFGTMAARNAVRDVGRVLGVSYQEVDQLAKLIPFGANLNEALDSVSELKTRYQEEAMVKRVVDIAKRLEGVARHASTHAAGVIISQEPLKNYVPVQKEAQGERIITQYDMYSLDLNASSNAIGLLKMDFLGLANLTILEDTQEIVRQTRGVDITLDDIPLEDQSTFALLARGETTGVFQLESDGMKRWLKELKPTTFEDILSMVALYRPGPMEAIPDFIDAKHGRKAITYLHPTLKPILEKTYGVIVTQDQVLEIARSFASMTYTEADVLRKAVGKKIKKLLEEQQEKFLSGAIRQGADAETARRVWEFIEPFARYGFNRAHAACYAMISYQTAYLKTHYPAEFMAALLTSEKDKLDKVGVALLECERIKLKVLPPDVNESQIDFSVDQTATPDDPRGAIRFGLSAIKNVGVQVATDIVSERKAGRYLTLSDFIKRLTAQVVNRKALESLIKAGALDQFGERNQMLAGIENILRVGQAAKKISGPPQGSLFGTDEIAEAKVAITLPEVDPADKRTKLRWERELLSMYVSEHPLAALGTLLIGNGHRPINSLSIEMDGQRIKVAGVVTQLQKITTKNGSAMAFARLEDTTGALECIIFPRTLEAEGAHWVTDQILSVNGKLSSKDKRGEDGHELKLIIDTSTPLGTDQPVITDHVAASEEIPVYAAVTHVEHPNGQTVPRINRDPEPVTHQTLTIVLPETGQADLPIRIKQVLSQYPGLSDVKVMIKKDTGFQELVTKTKVTPALSLRHQLAALVGPDNVRLS